MAKYTMEQAVFILDTLDRYMSEAGARIRQQYDVPRLREEFADAASHIYIPQPDADGVIPQFDGYRSLEDVSVEEVRSRLLHEKEYWGGAYGVASHTGIIKQADVVTWLALFADEFTQEILWKNWEYYQQRTEHGSSLSACMYAWLACICGHPDQAYPFFLKSATADLAGGGKQWAGLVYIGGTHPAASGGAYMNAVHGFAGVSFRNGELTVRPRLPKEWKKMRFSITYRDKRYQIEIEGTKVHVEESV